MFDQIVSMSVRDILFYAIYIVAVVTSFLAFSLNSMFWLRLLTVISSSCYASYYYFFPEDPLWPDVISESGFVALNFVMIALLLKEKSQLKFTDEDKVLYKTYFSALTQFDFVKLMQKAEWKTCGQGYKLAEQGKVVSHLSFVYDGNVDVVVEDKTVAEVQTGSFIGEISFKLKQPANATVVTHENARVIQWPQHDLDELLDKNQNLKICFDALISTDLAKKLTPGNGNKSED